MSGSFRFVKTTWLPLMAVALHMHAELRAVDLTYLDNGTLRLGVDLDAGGAIAFLRHDADGRNLVNVHDYGRYIQQSYYSGPRPFNPQNNQHPGWSGWGWNPVQAGDAYGNASTVLEYSNNGTQIYTKTIPMQWALNNVPTEAYMETWITLDGNVATVTNRLTNHRTDTTTVFPPEFQELPAIYTVGTLHRLVTYQGFEPFANAPLTHISNNGPPWVYWQGTENWAALVDNNDFGLGVFHAGAVDFVGGFHGTPNVGGPTHNNTGYVSPLRTASITHDMVFEYQYQLVVGDVAQIRAFAYANAPTPRAILYHELFHHASPGSSSMADIGWHYQLNYFGTKYTQTGSDPWDGAYNGWNIGGPGSTGGMLTELGSRNSNPLAGDFDENGNLYLPLGAAQSSIVYTNEYVVDLSQWKDFRVSFYHGDDAAGATYRVLIGVAGTPGGAPTWYVSEVTGTVDLAGWSIERLMIDTAGGDWYALTSDYLVGSLIGELPGGYAVAFGIQTQNSVTTNRFDNFMLEAYSVPEPVSAVIAALAATFAVAGRQRR